MQKVIMKKSILLIIIPLCINVNGQRNFWSVTKGVFHNGKSIDFETEELLREKSFLKENGVKTRQKMSYSRGKNYQTNQTFDREGRISHTSRKVKKGENTKEYIYDNGGNISNVTYRSYKGRKSSAQFEYDGNNNVLSRETINYKGNYFAAKYTFNAKGKIVAQLIFEKDKISPLYSLEHTYYENGSKKTETYKKKGKVVYVWNYDCKPEGELINVKNKDNSTICIKEEVGTDGNRVIWKRDFDDKGKLVKTKTTYDRDSVLIERKTFTQSDRILSHMTNKKEGGMKTLYYDKKSRETSSYETFVNEDTQLKKIVRKGKWGYTYLYSYDNKLKSSDIRIYKQNTYVEEYTYSFY